MKFEKLAMACLAAISMTLTACEPDDGGGSSGNDSPFLSMTDLSPGAKLKTMTDSEVRSELQGESFVYSNKPDDKTANSGKALRLLADASADDDSCYEDVFNGLVATGDAKTLTFSGRLDAGKCIGESEDGLNIALSVGAFFQFTCDSVDLSQYVGKTLGDIVKTDDDVLDHLACANSSLLSNLMINTDVSGKTLGDDGKPVSISYRSVVYSYQGDANGAPCSKTSAGEEEKFADGCLSIDREVIEADRVNDEPSEDEGTENYSRYEMTGITGLVAGDKPYFQSGTIKAQINGWTGSLTYSGVDTPPLFDFQSEGKALKGVLGVSGNGYLGLGDETTMVAGSCGLFHVQIKSGSTKLPALATFNVALSSDDVDLFSDAECKTPVTSIAIVQGTSATAFYVKPKANTTSTYLSVRIAADSDVYSGSDTSLSIQLTGIDSGSLKFVGAAIRVGDCTKLQIAKYDDSAATGDVSVVLSSSDADLFADAACTTATTKVVLKTGQKAVDFYAKAHADASSSVVIKGEPPATTGYLSDAYLDVDRERVFFGTAPVMTATTCGKITVNHGYESGDLTPALVAMPMDVVVYSGAAYSDAACTTVISANTVTIAKGAAGVDFYVKPSSGADSVTITVDPEGEPTFQSLDLVVGQ